MARKPWQPRFWSRVNKTDGCWLWTGYTRVGYGHLHVGGKMFLVHRLSWEIAHGPIPDGMCVLHNCPDGDNPSCVNPDHLWLGTVTDNNVDKAFKGRATVGTRARSAKLTEDQVRQAHERHAAGEPQKDIAKDLGVSRNNLSAVLSGKTWKHLGITPTIRSKKWHSRQISGELSPRAKLTEANARDAFARYRAGESKAGIARAFGVSDSTIDFLLRGKTWRHLGLFKEAA